MSKDPNLTDEEKEMVKGVLAWLNDDKDRFPYPYPERLTEESHKLKIDNREIFNKEIYPLVERIKEICEAKDIPYFSYFFTEETEGSQTGGYSFAYLPYRVCEIIAFAKIIALPHEFTHAVIHNAQLYEFMMQQLRSLNEGEDEDE